MQIAGVGLITAVFYLAYINNFGSFFFNNFESFLYQKRNEFVR